MIIGPCRKFNGEVTFPPKTGQNEFLDQHPLFPHHIPNKSRGSKFSAGRFINTPHQHPPKYPDPQRADSQGIVSGR